MFVCGKFFYSIGCKRLFAHNMFFSVTCPRVHATEDKGVDNSQIPFQTMSFFGVVIQWLVKRRCALRRQIAGGRLKVAFY